MRLPEDDLKGVEKHLQFIYTGNVCVERMTSFKKGEPNSAVMVYSDLCDLYIFGEKIHDVRLMNAVLDATVQQAGCLINGYFFICPTAAPINTIYNGTLPGSPARRLMVDILVTKGDPNDIRQEPVTHNLDFLADLTRALLQKKYPPGKALSFSGAITVGTYHESVESVENSEMSTRKRERS